MPSHCGAGGTPWSASFLPLLLTLFLGTPRSVTPCTTPCLCASDILSCSGRSLTTPPFHLPGYILRLDLSHNNIMVLSSSWTSQNLNRLTTLVLNRNFISQIQENAFAATPHLTHLDLSSNQLTALYSTMFSGLQQLQELLLFANHISHVQTDAFRGLLRLQRLYLSGNKITEFPTGLYEEQTGPRNLTFLDLSGNQLTQLPVQTLLWLQSQSWIYLQDNPLVCDCPVQGLIEYWVWKKYRPVVDFEPGCNDGGDYGCGLEEESKVLDGEQSYQVDPGSGLSVPCPVFEPSVQEGALVFWVTPYAVLNSSDGGSDSTQRFSVLPNGTLQIVSSQVEDSGTYSCVVSRGRHLGSDYSLEVNIIVGNSSSTSAGSPHRSTEHFNTAFTTLASCVVSIVLVLLYLYLTPCRCSRNGGTRGCGGRAIVVCSDPREVEAGQRRANGKRVAFLDPQVEECNNGGSKAPALTLGHTGTEGILKNGSRTVGQTFTDSTYVV